MLVPGGQEALHTGRVLGMPGDSGPVDVPDQHPSAGPQNTEELGQGGGDVGHVLEHLDGQGTIEVGVRDRQRRHVALLEGHVVVALAALRGEREHRLTGVDADHRAFGPNPLQRLHHVETRPATGVENAVSRHSRERLVHERPAAQDVPPAVDDLHLRGELLVELELCHVRSQRSPPAVPWWSRANRDLERQLRQAARAAAAALVGRAAARRGLPPGDQARGRGLSRPARRTSWQSGATRSPFTARRPGTGSRSSRASGSRTWSPASTARRAFRGRSRARSRPPAAGSGSSRSTCRTGAYPAPSTTSTSSPGWPRCASWSRAHRNRASSAAT